MNDHGIGAGIARRDFITGAAGLGLAGLAPAAAAAVPAPAVFPPDFVWGSSTSAYQIEGAVTAEGRGPSIWDTFCRIPGKIRNGDSGDTACDHYHRFAEDIALMAAAGLTAYRFSVAWPRVQPDGTGPAHAAGLDFYDRLVDGLLARGIRPWACLYHWDLPQALQDRGGWTGRAVADRFADYAQLVAARLGDRVRDWAMLNEPGVVALFGHGVGGHAPDLRGKDTWFAAIHHQNLAQGRGLAALRALGRGWRLGTVLNLQPVRPVGGHAGNREAAAMFDAVWNRACLDPLLRGQYPERLKAGFQPLIRDGDMAAIAQPIDFLGLNYYSPMYQQPDPGGLFGTGFGPAPEGTRFTGFGWPIDPEALVEQLAELRDHYGNPPVYITENGAAFPDWIGPEGKAEDGDRIFYLRDHLLACHRALAAGCALKGYFAWSLLDNFEWAEGYSQRFGLVAVDRQTLARTPKASYYWFGAVAHAGQIAPP